MKLNGGRRRGRRGQAMPTLERARAIIRPLLAAGVPFQCHDLETAHGISHYTFDSAIAAEKGRQEAVEAAAVAEFIAGFSKTGRKKFEIALRAYAKTLAAQFEQTVAAEVKRRFDQAFPLLEKEQEAAAVREKSYRELLQAMKKTMPVADFMFILSCLHPDSRGAVTEERLTRAFQLLEPKKFAITGEK